jgi:predicted ATPase
MTRLARRQPLVIICEDMHWADEESVRLAEKLAKQVTGLLVLTGRTALLPGLVSPVLLAPLADRAITHIAEHRFGGHALHDTLAVWIANQAQGNPLYAEELSQALLHADAIFLDRDAGEVRWTGLIPALPLSLRELLLAHFDGLPPLQQEVLKRAVVAGSTFEVAAVLALGPGRLRAEEGQAALAAVAQRSFLKPIGDSRYQFNHPLMHEAIYESLSFAQRQGWHTQVGDWLAAQPGEALLEQAAYHYLRGKDGPKAVEFGMRAGQRARELGAYIGALDYFEQILAWPQLSAEARAQALEGQADVLVLQGDHAAARRAYEQAMNHGSLTAAEKLAQLP